MSPEVLTRAAPGEPSAAIKRRILGAQRRQLRRLKRLGVPSNAALRHCDLRGACPMSAPAEELLRSAMREWRLSARSYDKILKISRTVADLAEHDIIQPEDVAEAIQYRSLDCQLWG